MEAYIPILNVIPERLRVPTMKMLQYMRVGQGSNSQEAFTCTQSQG